MVNAGKTRHIRDLGKTYKNNAFMLTDMKHDISSIQMQNQSGSMDISFMNKSNSKILNNSLLNGSKIVEPSLAEIEEEKKELEVDLNVLKTLKVEDILRSLTSKIYKFQKINNY